jgi:hypothetical protein
LLGVALWVQRLHMAELTPTPFEISRYDNPESIRIRKYITGTQFVSEGDAAAPGFQVFESRITRCATPGLRASFPVSAERLRRNQ